MTETRQIVVPGEVVAKSDQFLPGQNTYLEGGDIRALRLGVKSVRGDRVNVISLNGRYEPFRGDMVIGTVVELGPSNWYINVGASNDVGMHVNDVPWRVEFGETSKYLDIGDTVLLKIVHVDEMKKAQVSMKDRQCRKLTGGLIWEVAPSKVPRIVGRNGSMIGLIKDYTSVRIFVGQNGVVWIDGEAADVSLALEALNKIETEAHTSGLTDRMKAWLESQRPGAAERKRATEEEARGDEEEFQPSERRPRPKIERAEEDEDVPLRERETRRDERRGPREGGREERRPMREGGDERRGPREGAREERRPMREGGDERRPMREGGDERRGPREGGREERRPMREGGEERRPMREGGDERRGPREGGREERRPMREGGEERRPMREGGDERRGPREGGRDERRPMRDDRERRAPIDERPRREPLRDAPARPERRMRDEDEDEADTPARRAPRGPPAASERPARRRFDDDEEEDAPARPRPREGGFGREREGERRFGGARAAPASEPRRAPASDEGEEDEEPRGGSAGGNGGNRNRRRGGRGRGRGGRGGAE